MRQEAVKGAVRVIRCAAVVAGDGTKMLTASIFQDRHRVQLGTIRRAEQRKTGDPCQIHSGEFSGPTDVETPQRGELSAVESALGCRKEVIRKHLHVYFERVHPLSARGFLHPGTTFEHLDTAKISRVLSKVLIISAAPFVDTDPFSTSVLETWSAETDTEIMRGMGTFSIPNLQMILLWSNQNTLTAIWARRGCCTVSQCVWLMLCSCTSPRLHQYLSSRKRPGAV